MYCTVGIMYMLAMISGKIDSLLVLLVCLWNFHQLFEHDAMLHPTFHLMSLQSQMRYMYNRSSNKYNVRKQKTISNKIMCFAFSNTINNVSRM